VLSPCCDNTKKKELVGNYKNGGTDYRPKGDPQRVKVHDFEDKELGKVVPYGVYDISANAGWVSVGINGDTAQFAVASIRRWLDVMGRERYPGARELTITADGGGSNGSRVRLWKVELQKFADTTGLVLHVHHYPPGTSKWNKIEHRMFCHITQNWRARPLTDRLAVVELIAATTTKTGLKVESALDTATYEKGIKVSDAEMKTLDIEGDAFHPGRVGRDIATSASRRTGRDTLASSSSHQANMPVIPSFQCTNSLCRLTAMDSINRPACIFAPL
jgi:hypothetical protein